MFFLFDLVILYRNRESDGEKGKVTGEKQNERREGEEKKEKKPMEKEKKRKQWVTKRKKGNWRRIFKVISCYIVGMHNWLMMNIQGDFFSFS
jgi:hypothetical protein